MHDVIVVGGGPSGSAAAYRLAVVGYRVLVLDKKRGPGGPVCCTGIVSRECLDAFAVGEETVLWRVKNAVLFSPSGKQLEVCREETQAVVLDRSAFNVALAERAMGVGVEYVYDSLVQDIGIGDAKAAVRVSYRGKEEIREARAVVLAGGFGSGLSRKLGLGGCGDFAVGAQAVVESPHLTEVEVYFGDVAPGFFAWLVPTKPPLAHAGLISRHDPAHLLERWLAKLAASGRIASSRVEIACRGIPLRPPRRTYMERLLAVGDAAGQVKPTSGGGIYYGLIGAETAVHTLIRALKDGDLSAKSLARYERDWRRRLGRELRIGYRARQLFESLSERRLERFFDMAIERDIAGSLSRDTSLAFDWHSRVILKLLRYGLLSPIIRRERPSAGAD